MPISTKALHKLAASHGLNPETHTDEDVDKEIKNSEDDMEELMNRAQSAESQLVDADLAKYANRIGTDKDVIAGWKAGLISNREGTIKMLEAIPAPVVKDPKKPLHNREGAGNPAAIDAPDRTEAEKTKVNALIKNRATKLQEGGASMIAAHIQANKEIEGEIAAGMHK